MGLQNYENLQERRSESEVAPELRKSALLQVGKLLLEKGLITEFEYRRYVEKVRN